MPIDPEFWTETIGGIIAGILAWLPSLAGALLLLLLGWVVARIMQFILTGLLRRLGLDRLTERVGLTETLSKSGLEPSGARLIARLVYWLVLLVFVLAAAESLELSGVVDLLGGLIAYIPNVLAAALILLVGGLIARVLGDGLGALATQAELATGQLVGQVVRYVLLAFVAILAIEQLGLETTLLIAATIALLAATALALSVAFGLGSRELARNIMAGFHARDQFTPGQTLTVRGHTGKLLEVGSVTVVLETEGGQVSLPNLALVEEEVTVVMEAQSSP